MNTTKTPKLQLKESQLSGKLIIPQGVEEKIRHICSIIHNVEWSGVLFYKPQGSLDDGTFVATCLDIYVMDVGNATFTSYDESSDIVAYQATHRELLSEEVQEALIHSHNNMSAFFSGTDNDTLLEEGTDRNHFLSLIVNNAGNYVARITRKVTSTSQIHAEIKTIESSHYNTYNNVEIPLKDNEERTESKDEVKTAQWVEYFNLVIEKHAASSKFDEINERLRQVKQGKKSYTKPTPSKDFYSETPWWRKEYSTTKYENPLFQLVQDNNKKEDKADLKEDEKYAHNLFIQILTGSVLVNPEKIDVNTWVTKVDNIYAKRFNGNWKEIENWISNFIDALLFIDHKVSEATLDKARECYGESADSSLAIVYLLLDELSKIPTQSKVLDTITDILNEY